MSSPIPKHINNDSNASALSKQRKLKAAAGMTNKTSAILDTRSELADLVKRKAEISVGI